MISDIIQSYRDSSSRVLVSFAFNSLSKSNEDIFKLEM